MYSSSNASLTRLVRQSCGYSIQELLKQQRVVSAQELLREHGRSIQEVAESCGFDNARYFSRVFKSITGVTPSHYRRLGHVESELTFGDSKLE